MVNVIGVERFARTALSVELGRYQLDYLNIEPDCLDELSAILGNRASNGLPVGRCTELLRTLAKIYGVSLHDRALSALDAAER